MSSKEITTITNQTDDDWKAALCEFLLEVYLGFSPEELKKKTFESLSGLNDGKEGCSKEDIRCLAKAGLLFGLDTKAALMDAVSEEYRPLAIGFLQQLLEEYDCKSSSEKALAQILVNAFVRVIIYSHILGKSQKIETIDGNITGYYSMIGKEVDRANRQFISALTTLKQLKTPAFKINVIAKTAFVGEKQQFNKNEYNNSDENIQPK